MSKSLEIEKKYLIRFPNSWSNLLELFDDLIDIKRITQIYLKPIGREPAARVRKTVEGLTGDTNTKYDYNQKKFVEKGVNSETEFEISKEKYDDYLKKSHPDKVPLDKTRFVFKFDGQVFELDVFKGPLKGLAILEIELKNKNDEVRLPPFLSIIEEVSDDKRFNNFELSDKKLHKLL